MTTTKTNESLRLKIAGLVGDFLEIFERSVQEQTRAEIAAELRQAAARHPEGTARRAALMEAAAVAERQR